VPGGFSYGDYLRCGAIARFAPVMGEVIAAAGRGLPILGICNGFQVLCEAGLLPGALARNAGLHFVCRDVWLRVASTGTAWTSRFESDADLLIPLKSGEGRYVASANVIDELEGEGRVVFRYHDNPNGSLHDIAGVSSANGRVVGLMPHPEHAIEALTGPSDDGLGLFYSALDAVLAA
jgi:phosphoribosylformylglycinamidine synthase subunit PurQ / glutaminase